MSAEETSPPPARPRRRRTLLVVLFCLLAAIVGLGALVRFGVLLPQVQMMIEARTDGLKLGRFGRLKLYGLHGDLWRRFSVDRLTIADEKGVWLDARKIDLSWRYAALLQRRFVADSITAGHVLLVRRPTLSPKGPPSGGMPLTFDIDALRARIEMTPQFSYERGVYDLSGDLELRRAGGGQTVNLKAASVLRPGDFARVNLDMGRKRALKLDAEALEVQGGAIAGMLGLSPDAPFKFDADANGSDGQGAFNVLLRSGAATPLRSSGRWTPQGATATGAALLEASDRTKDLAQRFGPVAAFALSSRRIDDAAQDIRLGIDTRSLKLTATGPVEIGKRATRGRGLAVNLQLQDLAALVPAVGGEQARFSGFLSGDPKSWRLAGRIEGDRVGQPAFRLTRIGGPVQVTMKAGELAVEADLAGAGGQGAAAGLLGAAPTAKAAVTRLSDGRILLRSVHIDGAGLDVNATGRRGLIGDLSLSGDARLSNLAAALRLGAKGVLTARWTAGQSRAGRPWEVGVKASGEGLAVGMAELDRLLGAKPALAADLTWDAGRLAVTQARLTGAAATATASGVRDAAGQLAFKLGWTAQGPFRAGPVEISGKVSGDGALTGTMAAPRADLTADIDQIDLPRLPLTAAKLRLAFERAGGDTNGKVALTANSPYGPARGASQFRFAPGGVDLSGLDVDAGGLKANGAVSLRRATPSAADLTLVVGPGAFIAQGRVDGKLRIVDSAAGPNASMDLRAANVALAQGGPVVQTARLTANGPMSRLPYVLQANGMARAGRWKLDGRGELADQPAGYLLTLAGSGALGRTQISTVEPAVLRLTGAQRGARLRLAAGGGHLDVDADLGEAATRVKAAARDVGLGLLNQDLGGRFNADLTLEGRGGQLGGQLNATVTDAQALGASRELGLDGRVSARLAGDTLTVQASATNDQGLKADADLVLPADASAAPLRLAIDRRRPLRGTFSADGEVKPLWDLLVGGERTLSGHVAAQGRLAGTLADPRATGVFALDGGRFADIPTGLVLNDAVLRATLADNAVDVTQISASDGHGGKLAGQGRLGLTRGGASNLTLDLTEFRLIDNDMAVASASGRAQMNRAADGKVTLSGALTVDRADISANPPTPSGVVVIDVIERNKPLEQQFAERPAATSGPGITLDMTLKAPRRVYLRGRGLDAELSIDAQVNGTTARPNLTGTAKIVRGEYDFAGKRFVFDDRSVVYLSTAPERIRLDLTATRDDPSLTAVIRIKGTAARPDITLTSTPVLPNDEVLSQVLFGRSASQLSTLEAAQLAAALSALAGGGGFDLIGNLRSFAGLDRLALAGDAASGVSVAGGKYLTDDVYLEIIGGGREGPAAQVEWRVRRNLSLVSRLAGQGDARLSVRWRRDY